MSASYLRLDQRQALYLLKFVIAELADTYQETVVLDVWGLLVSPSRPLPVFEWMGAALYTSDSSPYLVVDYDDDAPITKRRRRSSYRLELPRPKNICANLLWRFVPDHA